MTYIKNNTEGGEDRGWRNSPPFPATVGCLPANAVCLFKPRHGAGGGAVAIAELQREAGKIEKAIAALVQIAEVFYIDNVAGGKEPPVAGEIYV